MVRFSAKEWLEIQLRVEDQDPDALRDFLDAVDTRDPTIAKRYEYSWVVLAYLEQYILSRQRTAAYEDCRSGPRQRYVRCPEPIWIRFAQAKQTGERLRRNCQVNLGGSVTGRRAQRRSTRVNALTKKTTVERKIAEIEEVAGDQRNDACQRTVSAPADPVRDFLLSLRPSLGDFYSHFMDMGIKTSDDLNTLFSWPIGDQELAMRVQFDQKMNFMQLNGLIIGLRERARSG
ncbi:hypothetical protein BS17DRAFT_387830 [Gyrodon lividus]|nr:hypothetical protein BS17DRAFT_387830 [Gyrodon lividus]